MQKEKRTISLGYALIPILTMVALLTLGSIFKLRNEPMLIISAFVAAIVALLHGYKWVDLQAGIINKIAKAMPATLVLLSVGFLIGSWMFSGTVPMMIYYGIQIINPRFLLLTAFIITSIVSVITGTSWGSAGTLGVALMGVAIGLGVSLPATAGAVVAGAYFGDKISPLSDTTNLAPIAAGSELYEHIRHMLYTTVPAMIIAMIVYTVAGLKTGGNIQTPENVEILLSQIDAMFNWNILLLLPVLIILTASVLKLPAMPVMLGTSIFSVLLGVLIQGFSLKNGFTSLVGGFNVNMTGFEGEAIWDVTRLINRGGVRSVTGTTVLVFCAMGFAGVISTSGILDTMLQAILKLVRTTGQLVASTVASCFTMAFLTGSSYLTILIPGDLFKETYIKKGLHPKNLSRTLEDSGTVLVPLIPWSAAGVYMTATLGVPTLEYVPWAILNYMGIVFALIFGFTGFGIAKINEEEQKKYLEQEIPTTNP